MRIHVSALGLAASLSGIARAEDGRTSLQSRSTNERVIFDTSTWKQPALVDTTTTMAWANTDATKVVRVYLKKQEGDQSVATAVPDSGRNSASTDKRVLGARQGLDGGSGSGSQTGPINLVSNVGSTSGSIILNLSDEGAAEYRNYGATMTPLFLELYWIDTQTAQQGSSYSSYFALSTDGVVNDTLNSFLSQSDTAAFNPAHDECSTGFGCGTSSTSSTSSQVSTGTATATPSSSTTAATASLSGSSAAPSGLSTGAIAGIAVACGVVGLALIGAAIWFCLRRRRTSKHAALTQNNGYTSDGAGMGIMADKEMPHVTDSPHSAYAPDRGQLHDPHEVSRGSVAGAGVGAGTGLMNGAGHTAHGAEDSYPPYSDHTPTPRASRAIGEGTGAMDSQTSLSGGGPRSPTPPISGRYAHLVEEGMTDDEIRRLEAEERALDMAIEDAGRSSRAQ